VIPELIIFVSRGITVCLNSGQHAERIKRFSIETYGKSRFGQRMWFRNELSSLAEVSQYFSI